MKTVTEKKQIINVCGVLGWLKEDDNFTTFANKDTIEVLRLKAEENIDKMLDYVKLTDADKKELERNVRDRTYDMKVLHITERADHRRQVRKNPITLRQGDFEDLIMETLTVCETCQRNTKRCNLRKVLKKIGVVEADPNREGGCEFYNKNATKR